MSALYPMLIKPRYDERIWGGHNLARLLGKDAPANEKIGESWEVYDQNSVCNGAYAGRTIEDLRADMKRELTGHVDPSAVFPMLTKLLDAQDVLSVQVHPDDAEAKHLEHEPYGKTECWYVIHAEPGAEIIYGFSRDTDEREYQERLENGTLNEILRSIRVHEHDVVYLPARTLHAIGAGIVVYELQQTSDTTYRIYDWDRKDSQGHARELHVEKAKEVLDFNQFTRGTIRPLGRSGDPRTMIIAGPYFTEESITAENSADLSTFNSPVALCALDNSIVVTVAGQTETVERYSAALIPAAAETYSVAPVNADTSARCLVSYVPTSRGATRHELLSRGYCAEEVDTFLSQFAPVT